jgi:hypothetical protein
MCEVPTPRTRAIPPPTERMRAVLAAMVLTDSPVIWDYADMRHSAYTLDGAPLPGSAVTGLGWRGFIERAWSRRHQIAYRPTERGRALLETGG